MTHPERKPPPVPLDYATPERPLYSPGRQVASFILKTANIFQFLAAVTFTIDLFNPFWGYNAILAFCLAAPTWIAGAVAFACLATGRQPRPKRLLVISATAHLASLLAFAAVFAKYAGR